MIDEHNYNRDFSLLNLEHIRKRFGFIDIRLVTNQMVYITSKHDEWFIEYDKFADKLVFYHKNKMHITKNYHKENKMYMNIFQIFSYISRHDYKIFNVKNTKRKNRLMMLLNILA